MGKAVISYSDSSPVFEPGKQVFNKMMFCVTSVIVRDLDFAVRFEGMHGVMPFAKSANLNQLAS